MFDLNFKGVMIGGEGQTADSSHHTTYTQCMRYINNQTFNDARHWFFDENGDMRRHPERLPVDFTRDQFIPFLAYLAITKTRHAPTEAYYKKVKKNKMFFFNSHEPNGREKAWWDRDFIDPAMIGLFNRATNGLRALVWLGDLHILLTVLFKMLTRPNSHSDENIIMYLVSSHMNRPTWFANVAWRIYFFRRAVTWQVGVDDFWNRDAKYYPENAGLTIKAIRRLLRETNPIITGAHTEYILIKDGKYETCRHDNKFSFLADSVFMERAQRDHQLKDGFYKVRFIWEFNYGNPPEWNFIKKCKYTINGNEFGPAITSIDPSPIKGRLHLLHKRILAKLGLGW